MFTMTAPVFFGGYQTHVNILIERQVPVSYLRFSWYNIRDIADTFEQIYHVWEGYPDPPVSSIKKTDRHNITEILLKVVLNTIIKPNQRKQWHLQTDSYHSKKIYWQPSPRVLTPTILYEKFQFLSLTEIFLIYSLCVHELLMIW
jgi:hypothetical protein